MSACHYFMSCFFNKQSWLLLFALTTPLHFQWLADLTVSGKKLPSQTVLLSVPELSMYCYCFVFKWCFFEEFCSIMGQTYFLNFYSSSTCVTPYLTSILDIVIPSPLCLSPHKSPLVFSSSFYSLLFKSLHFQLILCPVYIYIPIFIYHVEEFFNVL